MQLRERLHQSEAQAHPLPTELELPRAVPRYVKRREERLEDVRQTRRIDADAAVLDLEDAAALDALADTEADAAAVGGELDRVEQQMLQHVADHARLDPHAAGVSGYVQ